MTIVVSTSLLSGLTDFVGERFRAFFAKGETPAIDGDIYERAPFDPKQVASQQAVKPSDSWYKPAALCDSERHELDTMSMIRGALYTKD